jgi:hypothetical protein
LDKSFLIIRDPETDTELFLQEIRQLDAVTEPAHFWAAIANSAAYSSEGRRQAVFQLFQRHVSPGITLAELARSLNNPRWLAGEDLSVVTNLAGELPVEFTLDDTIFVLRVFPELMDDLYGPWSIYLRVGGKVEPKAFLDLLRGEDVSDEVRQAELLELAFSPDDPVGVG